MPGYLTAAYNAEAGANNAAMYQQILGALPTGDGVTFLARTVQLPKRVLGVGQLVRRDNGAFESPGYQPNVGRVEVTFIHELAQTYNGSAIWALLTVWRAFAKAGEGPDFPNSPDLQFGLSAAATAYGAGGGLMGTAGSDYRQDFTLTLLTPVAGATDADTTLAQGPGYTVKNAWPADFGLEQVNYDSGRTLLELRASFQCDDVVPDTTQIPNLQG